MARECHVAGRPLSACPFPWQQDRPRGEVVPVWELLFRAALLRTTRTRFRVCGSPMIYAAVVTGLAWMASWQGWQTTRVLRRFLAMRAAHAGWFGPAAPRLASLLTWCTSTLPGSPHSSHRRVRSRWISSLRGWGAGGGMRSARTAFLSRDQGNPAEPGYQVRLAVAVDPGLEARSQPVPVSRSSPGTWRPSSTRWTGTSRRGSSASTSRRTSAGCPGARRRWRAGSSR